ncbi:hypothetical protein ABZ722_19680 [Streptomyces longwoodensis]|uniref:hypothetical protein n=1 Tax=Streptomyces longwoodensis TaxID=68231 RepID=UPI00340782E7
MAEQSIALIGAASALAGVALTGAFTLLKGRQDRLDKQLDRDEQRLIMHREARRDAYACFLTAYHEVDRSFAEVRKVIPPPDLTMPVSPQMPATESAITALAEAGSTVSLEGPAEMSALAHDVVVACAALLREFAQLVHANAGSHTRLWAYDCPTRDQAEEAMDQAYSAFAESARKVLGGDAPGMR